MNYLGQAAPLAFNALGFIASVGGQWGICNGIDDGFSKKDWHITNSSCPYSGAAHTLNEAVLDFRVKNEEWVNKNPER